MEVANYLVLTADGILHGYVRKDILLCHLAENKGDDVKLYALNKGGWSVRYRQITEAELRGHEEKN